MPHKQSLSSTDTISSNNQAAIFLRRVYFLPSVLGDQLVDAVKPPEHKELNISLRCQAAEAGRRPAGGVNKLFAANISAIPTRLRGRECQKRNVFGLLLVGLLPSNGGNAPQRHLQVEELPSIIPQWIYMTNEDGNPSGWRLFGSRPQAQWTICVLVQRL